MPQMPHRTIILLVFLVLLTFGFVHSVSHLGMMEFNVRMNTAGASDGIRVSKLSGEEGIFLETLSKILIKSKPALVLLVEAPIGNAAKKFVASLNGQLEHYNLQYGAHYFGCPSGKSKAAEESDRKKISPLPDYTSCAMEVEEHEGTVSREKFFDVKATDINDGMMILYDPKRLDIEECIDTFLGHPNKDQRPAHKPIACRFKIRGPSQPHCEVEHIIFIGVHTSPRKVVDNGKNDGDSSDYVKYEGELTYKSYGRFVGTIAKSLTKEPMSAVVFGGDFNFLAPARNHHTYETRRFIEGLFEKLDGLGKGPSLKINEERSQVIPANVATTPRSSNIGYDNFFIALPEAIWPKCTLCYSVPRNQLLKYRENGNEAIDSYIYQDTYDFRDMQFIDGGHRSGSKALWYRLDGFTEGSSGTWSQQISDHLPIFALFMQGDCPAHLIEVPTVEWDHKKTKPL